MKHSNLSIITLAGLLFMFFTTSLFSQDTTKVRAEKQEQLNRANLKEKPIRTKFRTEIRWGTSRTAVKEQVRAQSQEQSNRDNLRRN